MRAAFRGPADRGTDPAHSLCLLGATLSATADPAADAARAALFGLPVGQFDRL
jgi:hypothetical protein